MSEAGPTLSGDITASGEIYAGVPAARLAVVFVPFATVRHELDGLAAGIVAIATCGEDESERRPDGEHFSQ